MLNFNIRGTRRIPGKVAGAAGRRHRAVRAAVEALENRQLLTTVVVNSLGDSANDAIVTGPTVTLREAVNNANLTGGNQTIAFAPGLTGTITLSGTDLPLSDTTGTLTIQGPGANLLSISGNNQSQVFFVNPGTTAAIDGLTITQGRGDHGAGIENEGTLTATDDDFTYNTATGGGGGGIFTSNSLSVQGCSFEDNTTVNGQDGAGVQFYNMPSNSMGYVINSTFYGNTTSGTNYGAIWSNGTVVCTSDTIVNNDYGIVTAGGNLTLNNSILVGDATNDLEGGGTITINDSIVGNPAVSLNGLGNQTGVSFSSLFGTYSIGLYGGTTPTLPLIPGSPAIGAVPANTTSTPTTDQRGLARNTSAATDIGAFQSGPLVVNTLADSNAYGLLTLRNAITIADANTTATSEPITFAPGLTGAITLNGSDLVLDSRDNLLTIQGPTTGPGVTVSGGGVSQVFQVDSNTRASVSGLTITGGQTSSNGGGIENNGTLTLTDCTLSGNQAGNEGGAIFTSGGTLSLVNCTLTANISDYSGGAIEAQGTANILDSTIVGNQGAATITGGDGGGIDNYQNHNTVTIASSIIAGNSATAGPNVMNTIVSLGNNLIGATDGSAGWVSSDQTGTLAHPLNPLLAPLGNYGGPTQTLALLPGSPAIGGVPANTSGTPATDQRGFTRNSSATTDIGAFQSGSLVVNTLADSDASGLLTLRDAITIANANTTTTPESITFAPGLTGTITLSGSGLTLNNSSAKITIDGPGAAQLSVSGNNASLVFVIDSTTTAEIDGLTITGGNNTSAGGGIANLGTLTMNNDAVTNNQSASGGGGIFSSGLLTVIDSFISGNRANSNDGGGVQIYASPASDQNLIANSTISDNSAANTGGIWNGSTLTCTNDTVTGNNGGINNVSSGNSLNLYNSIVAGNSGRETNGTINAGNSIIGTAGTGITNGVDGNLTGVSASALFGGNSPGLYGGTTETLPLVPGSPAIGAGSGLLIPSGITTDQRGQPRIVNGAVDAGAFQSQGYTISATSGNNQTAVGGTAFAKPLVVTVAANNHGDPVAGGVVRYTVPASGASAALSASTATIAANGTANVTATANSTLGAYSISVSASGISTSAAFSLANVEAPGLVVDTLSDTVNPYDGVTSLREAIDYAESLGGNQTITFAPGLTGTITLNGSDLQLNDPDGKINIDGPGANLLAVSGNNQSQVFVITSSTTAAIDGLTITQGRGDHGAGIQDEGTLTASDDDFTYNNTTSGGGGGIFTDNSLVVDGCSFEDNTTVTNQDGAGVQFYNMPSNSVGYVINSTFYGNNLSIGAIWNNGTAVCTNDTVVDNDYGIASYGNLTVNNSILIGGYINDLGGSGSFTVNNSIVGNPAVALSGAGNQTGVSFSSLFGANSIGLYGGTTPTLPLVPGSPAIDAGSTALAVDATGNALATDQRSEPRIVNGAVDAGAFQTQGYTVAITGGNSQSATVNPAGSTGSTFSNLEVTVSSSIGDPVAGGIITFTANPAAGGASASLGSASATIASNGTASTTAAPNSIGGSFTVSAGAGGIALPALFSLTNIKAPATIQFGNLSPTYDGAAQYASATTTPAGLDATLSYTQDGQPVSAPTSAGTYSVTATINDPTYQGSATTTLMIAQASPTTTVVDNGGTFNGLPFAATATVAGVVAGVDNTPAISLEGVGLMLDYVDTDNNADLGATPPSAAGDYQVTASFGGSTDYAAASSSTTFTIAQARPVITVSDAGGTFNGSPFAATATVAGVVAGVDNTPAASLEGVGLTLEYLTLGGWNQVTNTPTGSSNGSSSNTPNNNSTVPTAAGTYEVIASFGGSADYTLASAHQTFTIAQAKPGLVVTDAGGTFNDSPFAATATIAGVVAGVDNTPAASLEGVGITLDYVNTATNADLGATPPTAVGSYKVTASFGGSTDYAPVTSSTSFAIAKATSTTTVVDNGGTFNGSSFPATSSTVTGAGNLNTTATSFCYIGTGTTSYPTSATAPTNAGTYTVTATYAGDAGHTASTSGPIAFTIAAAKTTVSVGSNAATGANPGKTVTFTATVAPVAPGGGTPLGTVQFYIDGTAYKTPVTLSNGVATITDAALALGNHSITATYTSSSTNFTGNSTASAFTQPIVKFTATLTDLAAPTILYNTILVTLGGSIAASTSAPAKPTGTVTITAYYGGKAVAAQTAAIAANGTFSATFLSIFAKVGQYTLVYTYNGDANYAASTSTVLGAVTYGVKALSSQTQPVKPGNTLNVQLELTDAFGLDFSSPSVAVTASGIALASNPSAISALPAGNAAAFTYSNGSYTLALKTTGLAAGTYLLYFTVLGDAVVHSVQFVVS